MILARGSLPHLLPEQGVTRKRFFRTSLLLMMMLVGSGVLATCNEVCGCTSPPPPFQIIGRVIDESGVGVGGAQLAASTGPSTQSIAWSISGGYFVLYGPGHLLDLLIQITPPAGYVVAPSQANPIPVKLALVAAKGLEITLRRQTPAQ